MANEKVKHVEDRPARGTTRADRPERTPINGIRDILEVRGIRPGFHACWVNEQNVPKYLDAGYTYVDYEVSFGSYHVNQGNSLGARYARDVGQGMVAFLMEQPQEWYDEDRAKEAADLSAQEAALSVDGVRSGLDHGSIQISREK